MSRRLLGKKRGMTQLFDEKGNVIACTVIEIEPNVVVQVKTAQKDGYNAIQLGYDLIKTKDPRTVNKRVSKPLIGHYAKAGVAPRRYLTETRVASNETFTVGQELGLEALEGEAFVDVMAMSKGKGYQGVMKLHNFAGGPAAHGSSFHRHAGGTGMRSTPGRCLPGGKRASHMGYDRKTVQNLKVVKFLPEEGVIVVKGAVPGPRNAVVCVSAAIKKNPAQMQHKQ